MACSDRRWLLSEVDRWRFGYTEASNDRDRERDKWIAAEREVERMRAALEKIARYEYRGGKSAPTSYPDINYPAAADIALLVLDRGEEE